MKFLYKKVDNSSLIVFRIVFGLVLTLEAWGSIFTGWIERTYIEPSIHFSLIGFEWLHPLDGLGMYYLYGFMGLLGLGVTLGYYYRISIIGYTILWSYCYVIHKISYNNHYYLMILLCFIMCFLPAHKYASLDVKYRKIAKETGMYYACKFMLIFQITCVYIYGAIAKMYPDWLDGTYTSITLASKASFPVIGSFFTEKWFYMGIAYGGILFDLLIIPLLAYRKTRLFGFILSIAFHSFNSIVFQVGVFPYLSLSFALFFFPSEKIHQLFLAKKPFFNTESSSYNSQLTTMGIGMYILIQIALPIRQHFIEDTAFWTEEAHKMSWRMMLRSKHGSTYYKVKDLTTQKIHYNYAKNLTPKQKGMLNTTPSVIWQYAQYIKHEAAKKGNTVAVYAISKKSLNRRKFQQFVNPNIDLANTPWNFFNHQPWIVPFKGW